MVLYAQNVIFIAPRAFAAALNAVKSFEVSGAVVEGFLNTASTLGPLDLFWDMLGMCLKFAWNFLGVVKD